MSVSCVTSRRISKAVTFMSYSGSFFFAMPHDTYSPCAGLALGRWPIHHNECQVCHEVSILSRVDAVYHESGLDRLSTFKNIIYPIVHICVLLSKGRKS